MVAPASPRSCILTDNHEKLLADLRSANEASPTADIITIIGHSNLHGLRMTSDPEAPLVHWDRVVDWLSPFRPKKLVLVGCQAGSSLPCSALFTGLPSLTEIYGSPAKLYGRETTWTYALLPYLLHHGKWQRGSLLKAGMLTTIFTGAIVLRRTRSEFKRNPVETAARWKAIDSFLSSFLRPVLIGTRR